MIYTLHLSLPALSKLSHSQTSPTSHLPTTFTTTTHPPLIPPDLLPIASDSCKSPIFSPRLECSAQKDSNIRSPLECATSNQEKSVTQHPDLGCNQTISGTIDTSIRSSTGFKPLLVLMKIWVLTKSVMLWNQVCVFPLSQNQDHLREDLEISENRVQNLDLGTLMFFVDG
ncbi:hypothetical protein Hanom_Chr04g00319051 [Helianthus anomalus]